MGRAAYVASAGVRKGELDPFAVAVLEEAGIDISRHRPMTFEEWEDWEGLNFDLIVTLDADLLAYARADASAIRWIHGECRRTWLSTWT